MTIYGQNRLLWVQYHVERLGKFFVIYTPAPPAIERTFPLAKPVGQIQRKIRSSPVDHSLLGNIQRKLQELQICCSLPADFEFPYMKNKRTNWVGHHQSNMLRLQWPFPVSVLQMASDISSEADADFSCWNLSHPRNNYSVFLLLEKKKLKRQESFY